MAHLSPSPGRGLNTAFTHVSFGLTWPARRKAVIAGDLAEIKMFVIADGSVRLLQSVQLIHVNDIDSYHKDEEGQASPQHTESGLDPQPNPFSIWKPDASDDE